LAAGLGARLSLAGRGAYACGIRNVRSTRGIRGSLLFALPFALTLTLRLPFSIPLLIALPIRLARRIPLWVAISSGLRITRRPRITRPRISIAIPIPIPVTIAVTIAPASLAVAILVAMTAMRATIAIASAVAMPMHAPVSISRPLAIARRTTRVVAHGRGRLDFSRRATGK
jgi:hypothetical protein